MTSRNIEDEHRHSEVCQWTRAGSGTRGSGRTTQPWQRIETSNVSDLDHIDALDTTHVTLNPISDTLALTSNFLHYRQANSFVHPLPTGCNRSEHANHPSPVLSASSPNLGQMAITERPRGWTTRSGSACLCAMQTSHLQLISLYLPSL